MQWDTQNKITEWVWHVPGTENSPGAVRKKMSLENCWARSVGRQLLGLVSCPAPTSAHLWQDSWQQVKGLPGAAISQTHWGGRPGCTGPEMLLQPPPAAGPCGPDQEAAHSLKKTCWPQAVSILPRVYSSEVVELWTMPDHSHVGRCPPPLEEETVQSLQN